FEREMLAARQHLRRHVDDVALGLDRLDRRAGGDPAHDRHRDWAAAVLLGIASDSAEVALDDAWGEAACAPYHAMRHRFRQLDHLDRARPVGQAADEAALLQCGYQTVDAGFRTQV